MPPLVHEEGVGFFVARARAVEPDFQVDDAVSEICHRLDELPLALELAAARVKALSAAQILERLDAAPAAVDRWCQRPARAPAHPPRDDRRGATTCSRRGATPLRPPLRLRAAAARSRRPRRSRRPTSTPCSPSSTRASSATRRIATGCSRRSASTPPSGSRRSGEAEEFRRRHAEHFLALAEEAEPHLRRRSSRGVARSAGEGARQRASRARPPPERQARVSSACGWPERYRGSGTRGATWRKAGVVSKRARSRGGLSVRQPPAPRLSTERPTWRSAKMSRRRGFEQRRRSRSTAPSGMHGGPPTPASCSATSPPVEGDLAARSAALRREPTRISRARRRAPHR